MGNRDLFCWWNRDESWSRKKSEVTCQEKEAKEFRRPGKSLEIASTKWQIAEIEPGAGELAAITGFGVLLNAI
jgi:hypothetical protein